MKFHLVAATVLCELEIFVVDCLTSVCTLSDHSDAPTSAGSYSKLQLLPWRFMRVSKLTGLVPMVQRVVSAEFMEFSKRETWDDDR